MATSDSPPRRIIGIGASAGGIDALVKVLTALPADLPHPVCIVLHIAPAGPSMLPRILDRRCALEVVAAEDGAILRAGQVHVAPPDRHLVVRDGHVELTSGPRQHGARPSVDVMFRSLAEASGSGAVAVVLSGALTDGSEGAGMVAQAGGVIFVQDPAEALVTGMPDSALAAVGGAAQVLPAGEIGVALTALGGAFAAEAAE